MTTPILGLDIGGANIKASHTEGAICNRAFRLWEQPRRLGQALTALLRGLPPAELLAVTMTGELCDCYESKRHGVQEILDAVEEAAGERRVRVWQTTGRFVDVAEARRTPLQTAAANWLALATFAGRLTPKGPALLLDIGSTTTDLIPLQDGKPVPRGRTDPERLRSRELVYTGVRRTPLCALLGEQVAAELFATTLDAYLLLGFIEENAHDSGTADQRPATRRHAEARLARLLGADLETSTAAECEALAQGALTRQIEMLLSALQQVAGYLPGPPRTLILSGEGEFLAREMLKKTTLLDRGFLISLTEHLGPAASQAACAYAVAVLASEEV